ncbi:MAG: phage holin family protein [Candidatus Moranbacteria bacterium]|nr:phage holin family protein [Candidatus Moranbacteria bacterium]
MKIILHWFLRALAVLITAYLLPGIVLKGFFAALVVAVVLGFFNTILRPVLVILTLPINILTLGLFTLVINAAMVMLASSVVPGFHVDGFLIALLFSVILWLVDSVLNVFEPKDDK